MNTNTTHIGVDVSKATLDIHHLGKITQICNKPTSIEKWLAEMNKAGLREKVQINCESTGSYSRNLIKTSLSEGFKIAQINPRRIKYYAKVINQNAKTDKLDAKLIAHFSEQYKPSPVDENWTNQDELKQHHTYISSLKTIRTQYINLLENIDLKDIKSNLKKDIESIEKKIKKSEEKLTQRIEKNSQNIEKAKLLKSNKGVGEVTTQVLLIWLPELGQVNRNQIASLAGLAPFNRDSGTKNKKAMIKDGRAKVRTALYMAALVASRCNPKYQPTYKKMVENGKPKKVALVAIARKLLIEMNTIIKRMQQPLSNESNNCSSEQKSQM